MNNKPTEKQINFVRSLIQKCHYNEETDYPDLENWSRQDVSKLIDELKNELG